MKSEEWNEPLRFREPWCFQSGAAHAARPAFELWCGAFSLLSASNVPSRRPKRVWWFVPRLRTFAGCSNPPWPSMMPIGCAREPNVLVDARWLPAPEPLADTTTPRVGCIGEEVVYVVLPSPSPGCGELTFDKAEEIIAHFKQALPHCEAGGTLLAYPWDVVDQNPQALCDDAHWWRHVNKADCGMEVLGQRDQLIVDPSANIEPFVVADTRGGPVILDRDVTVHSFTRLEGPCYVGPETILLVRQAAWRHHRSTLPDRRRIRSEHCPRPQQQISRRFPGSFLCRRMGEPRRRHADQRPRTTMDRSASASTASEFPRAAPRSGRTSAITPRPGSTHCSIAACAIGAFCNLLPTGSYLPTTVPSFTLCSESMTEQWDLRLLFQTASVVMRRRGRELTDTHANVSLCRSRRPPSCADGSIASTSSGGCAGAFDVGQAFSLTNRPSRFDPKTRR